MLDLEHMVLFGIAAASLLEETLEGLPPAYQISGVNNMPHGETPGRIKAGGKVDVYKTFEVGVSIPVGKNARLGASAGKQGKEKYVGIDVELRG